jgi:hypothetical protein
MIRPPAAACPGGAGVTAEVTRRAAARIDSYPPSYAVNLNPWTEAKVDTDNPERGPMLLIAGEKDHTAPPSITRASYKQQQDNVSMTEMVEMPGQPRQDGQARDADLL